MSDEFGTVYKGREKFSNVDTGEVIEVDKMYRKQVNGNFVKAYIKGLVQMLDVTGGSKLKVVNYLLENLSLSNNVLVITIREMAEKLGISTKTVSNTLKTLDAGNIIKRRTGAIMLNPDILYRGNDSKQKYLLIEFEKFNRSDEVSHAKDEYDSFNHHQDIIDIEEEIKEEEQEKIENLKSETEDNSKELIVN